MRKGIIVTIGNEKGGVGKTSIARHMPFTLAKKGYSVLCIDMDTQASLTKSLFITRDKYHDDEVLFEKTLMKGIEEGDLDNLVINVMPNFDFIPSSQDLENFPMFLARKFGITEKNDPNYIKVKKIQLDYYKSLIGGFKEKYDFIFIDTPPTASDFTYASAYTSDYILIAFQTQSDSLDGARNYLEGTLHHLYNDLDADFDVIGFLPNQLNKKGKIDSQVMYDAYELFGEGNIFKNIIPFTKAIQNVPRTGISCDGYWEKKMYNDTFVPITEEFLERLKIFENRREV